MTPEFPEGFLAPSTTALPIEGRLADVDERFVFDYAGYADDLPPG